MKRYCTLYFVFVVTGIFGQSFDHSRLTKALKDFQTIARLPDVSTAVPSTAAAKLSVPSNTGGIVSNLAFSGTRGKFQNPYPPSQNTVDTFWVGTVPNDTIRISGTWSNNGPVFVVNDGVLIIDSAAVTLLGNIFVLGQGQMICSHSSFFIPQQYFYQRSIAVFHQGTLTLSSCSLDFGGMSHNLVVADQGTLIMQDVYQNDWTTAGLYGHPVLRIDGTNLCGEYILTDSADAQFIHTSTLLLWHKIPSGASMNWSFPPGDTVNTYLCNSMQSGISGIGYTVRIDSAYDCLWGLMPVNGSNVTLSNSSIRTIGAWFTEGDTATVSGLVDNSTYVSFTAPLSDRTLQLNNCTVRTWSVYVFDSSQVHMTGSIIGESGNLGRSQTIAASVFCDGSGGYFWASDTTVVIASGVSVSSYVRSEKNGLLIYGYGSMNGPATAINNSILIVVQSSLPQDPIAEEGGVAWYQSIDGPSSGYTGNTIPVTGSVWIDQGPEGSFMDFGYYNLYYRQTGGAVWFPVAMNQAVEVRHSVLGNWNTTGLNPGSYELRLSGVNTLGDSVDAIKTISLLPNILGVEDLNVSAAVTLFPSPSHETFRLIFNRSFEAPVILTITDLNGRLVWRKRLEYPVTANESMSFTNEGMATGSYLMHLDAPGVKLTLPLLKQ